MEYIVKYPLKEESHVLIPVIYLNGKQDMVKDYYLTDLIEQKQIRRFKRRDGWVNLPADNIRKTEIQTYNGPERRGDLLAQVAN